MTQTQSMEALSTRDLLTLGLEKVAYVKPVEIDGEIAIAVYAADGTQIALMEDRDIAFATLRQHDLEPLSVH